MHLQPHLLPFLLLLPIVTQATVLPAHYNTRIPDSPDAPAPADLITNDSHVFGAEMFYEADVPDFQGFGKQQGHRFAARGLKEDEPAAASAIPAAAVGNTSGSSSKPAQSGRRPRRRPGRAHP